MNTNTENQDKLEVGDVCIVEYKGKVIDDALEVKSVNKHGNPTFYNSTVGGGFFAVTPDKCRRTLKASERMKR